MNMRIKIRERDLMYIDKRLREYDDVSVAVGVADKRREKIAGAIETGKGQVIARPFLRPVLTDKNHLIKAMRKIFPNWIRNIGRVDENFALQLVSQVQQYITDLVPGVVWKGIIMKKLAPSTIKAKGHDRLLIDTEIMFKSIKGEVLTKKIK